jgi:hypothetical protein
VSRFWYLFDVELYELKALWLAETVPRS